VISTQPLRVAIAGAGMVSRHHLMAWKKLSSAQVVAIADTNLASAQDRAAEFDIARVYANVEQMVARESPGALDIATPMQTHAALVEVAATNGIDTICQKPLAPTLSEARTIVNKTGDRIRLMVHENWRFRPYYRQIANWLAEGMIGTPRAFRFETLSAALIANAEGEPPPGLVRQPFLANMDRLIVLELLVHHLDTLSFLLGPLNVHFASLATLSEHVKGEDTASIALSAGASAGTMFASMSAIGAPTRAEDALTILGTRGQICLSASELCLHGVDSLNITLDLDADYQASFDAAIAHFVTQKLNHESFETTSEVHLHALENVEHIYRLGRM
jgi:predicted dehydrogenase